MWDALKAPGPWRPMEPYSWPLPAVGSSPGIQWGKERNANIDLWMSECRLIFWINGQVRIHSQKISGYKSWVISGRQWRKTYLGMWLRITCWSQFLFNLHTRRAFLITFSSENIISEHKTYLTVLGIAMEAIYFLKHTHCFYISLMSRSIFRFLN